MSPETSTYIPSLEALVAAQCELEVQTWRHPFGVDLLRVEPTQSRKLAAVILKAQVQRRFTSEIETEVPITRADTINAPVPDPPDDWSDHEADVVVERLGPPRECTHCPPNRPGARLCAVCGGIGSTVPMDGSAATCLACGGTGRVACTSCGGGGRSVLVRLQTIRHLTTTLRYAFVPEMPLSIEERIAQLLEDVADPPECLRFDMAPRRTGSAYRDVHVVDPVFEGHEFADAIGRARAAVAALAEGHPVTRQDIRAYAWPLLLLRWQGIGLDRTIALVIRPSDLAHLVVE